MVFVYRRKKEEGRRKKEEGRRKREEVRGKGASRFCKCISRGEAFRL
jgi:hypothetical protein